MDIVLATRNPHKLEEMRAILADLPHLRLRSAAEVGAPDVVEDAPALDGNARKKALTVARSSRTWALADDTGLEVDALGGAPGVRSARYAGEKATYADNCAKLLEALRGVPAGRRTARFRCVIALAPPPPDRSERPHDVRPMGRGCSEAPGVLAPGAVVSGRTVEIEPAPPREMAAELFEGVLEGAIAEAPRGAHGFGYDPLFLVAGDPRSRTLAELEPAEKNRISHRARAIEKLKARLRALAASAE